MQRPSKDEYYLDIAEQVAKRSTCIRRNYGAVLVQNDAIVSTGYNGSPRGEDNCCDTGYCEREINEVPKGERYELCVAIHAEANAIMQAGRDKTIGSTLYIAGREVGKDNWADPCPCLMCRRMIVTSGIKRVVGIFPNGEIKDIDFNQRKQ